MKKKILFLIVSCCFLLAACGNGQKAAETNTSSSSAEKVEHEEITLKHPLGETTLTTNPEKVVVLDYGILDALDFAGEEDHIVAVPQSSNIPEHLSKYKETTYANAGSLKEADFEKISELAPDLILITSRLTESYEELSKIAPTVFLTMPGATYMDTFVDNVNVLASIFTAKADLFSTELANIDARTKKIAEAANGSTALLIQANDSQFNVFGLGSRYAVLYEDFGFTISDETIAVSIHGQSSSYEYLVQQNPDYLFVIDRGAAIGADGTAAKDLIENNLTADMTAIKNNHVTYLDSTNWYTVSGGIQSTMSMLDEMESALGIEK